MEKDTKYGESTQVTTEYVMTYVAPLDPPVAIDNGMLIVNVRPGGWVKGPRISGRFISPGADWLRILPSGVCRLDVRALIQTEDGAFIFVSYNGIMKQSEKSTERLYNGERLTAEDVPYFVTAPTFQTSSEKYAWLNEVQTVGKMVEIKFGEDGYLKYDVFIVR